MFSTFLHRRMTHDPRTRDDNAMRAPDSGFEEHFRGRVGLESSSETQGQLVGTTGFSWAKAGREKGGR